MCAGLALSPEGVLHKATLMVQIYRDVVWMSARRADILKEESMAHLCGRDLDAALAYLAEFAPAERRQDFEAKVSGLFETKWLIDLIDAAMARVHDYPDNGKMYYEILSKSYMSTFKYTEAELLEAFSMERSVFYERKREAAMLLGVALWGFVIPEINGLVSDDRNEETTEPQQRIKNNRNPNVQ